MQEGTPTGHASLPPRKLIIIAPTRGGLRY
jgi:hypothetical protein